MTTTLETADDLMDDAIRYTNALAPRLSYHLRSQLVIAMRGGSSFARLPRIAEVLWAAREHLGSGGRDLLRRIAHWGAYHGQQTLRDGRGEAIATAIIRDIQKGEMMQAAGDPPIDQSMVATDDEREGG